MGVTPPRENGEAKKLKRKTRSNINGLSRKKVADRKSKGFKVETHEAVRIVNFLQGTSALQKACRNGDENRVLHLLEGSTDEHILRRDKSKETALHDAIRNGNTECCMLLLGNLENPLPTDLSTELLHLCSPDMSAVTDHLLGRVFQPFQYEEEQQETLHYEAEREAAQLGEDHGQIQQVITAENKENLEPVSVTTFDELKEQLTTNVENLRCLWENHKDMLFLFNQYLENASSIGGNFLPLVMFLEAAKLKLKNQNTQKKTIPPASRTTKLFLAYCYRQFGRQFLSTLRDVQFLVPTEDTLREVGSKELDIPSRIQPGFIDGMLEEAIKRYGPEKKLILSNDERKCKPGIVNGVGAAVYPGHESHEKLKEKEFQHIERIGQVLTEFNPGHLYPADFACFCVEEFSYNNEAEALEQRSTGYMKDLKRKADSGDSRAVYLLARQLVKRKEYSDHVCYKANVMNSYVHQLKDIRPRPYYCLNPPSASEEEQLDGRHLSETCIQYTEVKKNALLRKSQVPAALGFRTVAEAASIQPQLINPLSDEPEDEETTENVEGHLFDDTVSFSEQKRQVLTTLTHVVMPVYFPDLVLIQEGLGVIRKDSGGSPGFVADADASMVSSVTNSSIRVTVHITKTDSYKTTPRAEDVAILYCQMAAYLQYTVDPLKPPDGLIVEIDRFDSFMRVWKVIIDPLVLREALITIRTYFCEDQESIKEIKKSLPRPIKDIKNKFDELTKSASHLGDFPLLTFSQGDVLPCKNPKYNYCPKTLVDKLGLSGKYLIEAIKQSREDAWSYTQIKASTVMVYTLADVMRELADVTYYPIFWFPAATDFAVKVDKTITEFVLAELKRRGLNVVATSFDGKSHQRVTQGMHGEAQTVVQLVKDHWKSAKEVKTVQELQERIADQHAVSSEVPRLALMALEKVTELRSNSQERLKGSSKNLSKRYRETIDKHYPAQKIGIWRKEFAYLTFDSAYQIFRDLNPYPEEMEKLFGLVLYNPANVCEKPLYNLLDYTHNLNRLRSFTYQSRIPGVSSEAWRVAADAKDPVSHRPVTNLTRSMLDAGGRDQMSIRQTRTFFSPKVQNVMRINGFEREANWSELCYNFLVSVDDRNITAENRVRSWVALWNELISWTAIPTFPPCGSTIPLFKNGDSEPAENGLPMELFEATLSAIQARVQLYGACPEGYAARAISSIDTENFHGMLHRQHHHGAQTASVWEIEASLSHMVVALKIKKEKAFTSLLSPLREDESLYPIPMTGINISQRLILNSCRFDLVAGSNRSKEAVPRLLHEPPRGALPVRTAGCHRANEEN